MRYIIALHTGFIAFTLCWLSALVLHAPFIFVLGSLFLIYQSVKVYYLENRHKKRIENL